MVDGKYLLVSDAFQFKPHVYITTLLIHWAFLLRDLNMISVLTNFEIFIFGNDI